MKKVSIVILSSNNIEDIKLFLERFNRALDGRSIEIVLVYNSPGNENSKSLERVAVDYPFLKLSYLEQYQGYGHAILQGLSCSSGDYCGWACTDLQTDPFDIIKVYRLLQAHHFPEQVFIKGKRTGRSLLDRLCMVGMSSFESLYLSTPVWDINAQPTVFHRNFFESWTQPPSDETLDLYAYYQAKECSLNIIRYDVMSGVRDAEYRGAYKELGARWMMVKRTVKTSKKFKKQLCERSK